MAGSDRHRVLLWIRFHFMAFEVCWIRKASLVFGAAAFALSTVLAVFFGGLALGSFLFGRFSQRSTRPLRVYSMLEAGVGILAILSPLGFVLIETAFGWCYPFVQHSFALVSFVRFIFISLILLPPATLMGGTLPLFCRQYVVSEDRISRSVGFLYGLNTIGAAAGAAVCGFVLIRYAGVNATIWFGGILNLLIAVVVWNLPLVARPAPSVRESSVGGSSADALRMTSTSSRTRTVVSWLFFTSGFVALGNEILWTRYLSLLIHNTVYRYTLTLTVVLTGIVLGSILTAGYFDRLRRRALVFGSVQVMSGLSVLLALLLPRSFWEGRIDTEELSSQAWIIITVLITPAILSGISYPLAIRMVVKHPSQAGSGVGRMTALNTLGGIVGSLAVGFGILPFLGMHATLLAMTGLSLMIGFSAWLILEDSLSLPKRYGLVVVSAAIWLTIPMVTGTRLPQDFLADSQELVDFREGHSTHMAVIRTDDVINLEIDRMWQGQSHRSHQVMAAHVPALLHQNPKDVLVVGIGVGQTASRFLLHPIDRLDCVDIESRLVPLVEQHFESEWMNDDRVGFIIEDGRNYLTHTNKQYDLISIEVGQVLRPGLAGFYTSEFYHRARRHLKPNGVLCQFLPAMGFTPDEFRTMVGTFLDAFPQCVLWYNTPELLLIGTTSDVVELREDRLALIETDKAIHEDLQFTYWGSPHRGLNERSLFLAGFLAGPEGLRHLATGAEIYHDDLPYLEFTTSWLRNNCEGIASMLRKQLETVESIYDGPVAVETLEEVRMIQRKNVGNLAGYDLRRNADVERSLENNREAVRLLQRAIDLNPDNRSDALDLADILESEGILEPAGEYYRQALKSDQSDASVHERLGNCLNQLGRREEAVVEYERALKEGADDAVLHNNLGNVYAILGKADKAIERYRRALE